MSRITYVKIAGKNYPMSFSLGASKKIIEKYGSEQKMKAALNKSNEAEKIDIVTDMLATLIAQGCAYKNYFEKDLPIPEDAPVIDGKWTSITSDVLEIALSIMDIEELSKKIEECMKSGSKKEVEARAEEKNVRATQG